MAVKEESYQFKALSKKVQNLDNLVKVGFIVLIVMVATILISVVIFEIQTVNQNNQEIIQLLKNGK